MKPGHRPRRAPTRFQARESGFRQGVLEAEGAGSYRLGREAPPGTGSASP